MKNSASALKILAILNKLLNRFIHCQKEQKIPLSLMYHLNDPHLRSHGKIGDCEQSIVRDISLYISLPSSAKQREITKFVDDDSYFSNFHLDLNAVVANLT